MNFDYPSTLSLPKFLLKLFGVWQEKTSSWSYRIYGTIMHLALMEIIVFLDTLQAIDIFVNGSIIELSHKIAMLFTFYAMTFKSYWFIANFEEIKKMTADLQELLEFSSFGKAEKKKRLNTKICRFEKISYFYYSFSFVFALISLLEPLLHHGERCLPYDVLWDYKDNLGLYSASYIYEILICFNGISINCSLDIFLICFMDFVSVALQELSEEINSTLSCDVDQENLQKLQECIKCHIKINCLANDISKYLSFIFFIQALSSSVILCTSTFMITTVHDWSLVVRFSVYAGSKLFQIFLPCYYGSKISTASENISNSLFGSNWLQSSKNYKTALKIFLRNSKKCIVISAFNFVNVDFNIFTQICNATYSLYALLEKFKE